MSDKFNIRVYGILINNNQEVLLTDEYHSGCCITKFPGGGLEFGEGTIDCLKREYAEELDQPIEIVSHFYTTDFFQASAFNKQQQVISIYYMVNTKEPIKKAVRDKNIDFEKLIEKNQLFRWVSLQTLSVDDFTFPIDKKVAFMLKDKFFKCP